MNRLTFERLEIGPGEHVLEVGFGGSDLIEWMLAATDADVTGVDLSEAMVKRAQRRFSNQAKQGRLRLFTAAVENLPLQDASVDRACSVNSIYFWPDPAPAMEEFARVLRPRGRLVLCFQTPEAVRAWPGHVHGFRSYGADEVAALMEAAGFQSLRLTTGEAAEVGEFFCIVGERGNE
jgi:ubiquinone/menaquinone biosynthesis C-methylase UbiE